MAVRLAGGAGQLTLVGVLNAASAASASLVGNIYLGIAITAAMILNVQVDRLRTRKR